MEEVALYVDVPLDVDVELHRHTLTVRNLLKLEEGTVIPFRRSAGENLDVLRVKGSGWDMGSIEAAGFPAVRLDQLRRLRARDDLDDDEFARAQRAFLIDPQAPSPSVEMLLHAFLPAAFVDHTHATAVLSLIDQPDSEKICADVYGGRLGFVPYIMPGFALAKKSAEASQSDVPKSIATVTALIPVRRAVSNATFMAVAPRSWRKRSPERWSPPICSARTLSRNISTSAPLIRPASSSPQTSRRAF